MNEENLLYSTNHVAFMHVSESNAQFSSLYLPVFTGNPNVYKNDEIEANKSISHHTNSELPTKMNHGFELELDNSNNEEESNIKTGTNSPAKTISSDPRVPFSEHWKNNFPPKAKLYHSMPYKMSNKMTLQKSSQMSLGGMKINKKHFHEIDINGQKVKAGLGFPTKMAITINKQSEKMKNNEKSFDNLESFIQQLKDEQNKSSVDKKSLTIQDESFNPNEKDEHYFENIEKNILKEINGVNSSIDKILQERKEYQMQHRQWIQNMKKKIYQVKLETKNIKNDSLNSTQP